MDFKALLIAATISELQSAGDFKQNQIALVLGASAVRDGGMAFYVWDEDATDTDTSSTTKDVIQVTGQTNGRWLLLNGGDQVNVTASTLAVSGLNRNGKRYTINAAAGCAATLPAATGSGDEVEFIIGTTITSNTTTIKVTGNDIMTGQAIVAQDAGDTSVSFETAADSDTITLNGSTTGGIKGDRIRLVDIAADTWHVEAVMSATGTEATPFSATVT
jgi:hypothetical protein